MEIDTGAWQALTTDVLARLEAVERNMGDAIAARDLLERVAREAEFAEIMNTAGLPAPPPERARKVRRDRRGLRLVGGGG